MAKLQKINDRWEWRGTFEERLLAKNAGFQWNGLEKIWYTYNDTDAYKLRDYVETPLDEAVEIPEDTRASYSVDTSFFPPVPEGLEYRPYQRAGIEFMVNRPSTLLADPPGTGKTIQIAGMLNTMYERGELNGRVLIVAPASMTLTWGRELEKWLIWKPSIHVYGASKARRYAIETFKPDISVFSYERLCTAYKNYYQICEGEGYSKKKIRMSSEIRATYGVVILDEAHFCKGEEAKRTLVAMAFSSGAYKRVFMTGTPMLNRPIELWPLISSLDYETWHSRDKFANYFCERHLEKIFFKPRYVPGEPPRPPQSKNVWVEHGAAHIEELNKILRSTIMIRREKHIVLSQLPSKSIQTVELPVTCRELAEEFEEWNRLCRKYGDEDTALEKLFGGNLGLDLNVMAEVRQNVALAKIPHIKEFVENLIEQGEKVIVMAHHRAVVEALMEAFSPYNPVKVVGGMSAEDKQKSVDSFQKDVDTKVFVGNIRAAGVGLTLTASSTVVFAELDFTPGVMEQCEDRAHRIGQKSNVNVYRLVLKDSLDSYLLEMLKNKGTISEKLLR